FLTTSHRVINCRHRIVNLIIYKPQMRKLEITLSEEQYQHIQEEIKYYNRVHLSEGVFGGYELTLKISVPDLFKTLELKLTDPIKHGEVEYRFVEEWSLSKSRNKN